MQYTDELKNEYEQLWNSAAVQAHRISTLDQIVNKILGYQTRYKTIEAQTGVPWWLIACLHARESSLNFNAHLHNGDPLVDLDFGHFLYEASQKVLLQK